MRKARRGLKWECGNGDPPRGLKPQPPPAVIEVGSYGGLELKRAISVKLVEFLGEYTDDVLAE